MSKPIYILGTGLSHDGSACLLKDGALFIAIEKERITRKKHDGQNDFFAIQYCLEAAGIPYSDLSLVVQNANFSMLSAGNDWFYGPRHYDASVPVVSISHHIAHAYSAVATSPYDEAGVLVIDGCGNAFDDCIDLEGASIPETPVGDLQAIYFEKDSYYAFGAGGLDTIYKDFSPWGIGAKMEPMAPNTTRHSIGGLYLAASMYIFLGFEDPGKLMGLAPYGRDGRIEAAAFELTQGRVFVRYDWMERFRRPARTIDDLHANFQEYADLARWIQAEVERAIVYVVRHRLSLRRFRRLCYSGGVALNAVANKVLADANLVDGLYIPSAAGDNGLSIGCAYYGWLKLLGRERIYHDGSVFLGRGYSTETGCEALKKCSIDIMIRTYEDRMYDLAELLCDGFVVGWFQGGCEFGPRALGNRSILADPRRPWMRDFINREIKFREDFRPFAPVVLADEVSEYFEFRGESKYMLLVAQTREKWKDRIPAVVHQDGSARIQTLSKEFNPLLFRLLSAFRDITGLGVLLNTSLNRKGMPIVETPDQAVELFVETGLDALVIGDRIARKRVGHDRQQAASGTKSTIISGGRSARERERLPSP